MLKNKTRAWKELFIPKTYPRLPRGVLVERGGPDGRGNKDNEYVSGFTPSTSVAREYCQAQKMHAVEEGV